MQVFAYIPCFSRCLTGLKHAITGVVIRWCIVERIAYRIYGPGLRALEARAQDLPLNTLIFIALQNPTSVCARLKRVSRTFL